MLGDKFVDIEEKYDLTKGAEGFGSEGEGGENDDAGLGEEEATEDADEY
jgi:hypothetical protein